LIPSSPTNDAFISTKYRSIERKYVKEGIIVEDVDRYGTWTVAVNSQADHNNTRRRRTSAVVTCHVSPVSQFFRRIEGRW
jgi:hypothetical protein